MWYAALTFYPVCVRCRVQAVGHAPRPALGDDYSGCAAMPISQGVVQRVSGRHQTPRRQFKPLGRGRVGWRPELCQVDVVMGLMGLGLRSRFSRGGAR